MREVEMKVGRGGRKERGKTTGRRRRLRIRKEEEETSSVELGCSISPDSPWLGPSSGWSPSF